MIISYTVIAWRVLNGEVRMIFYTITPQIELPLPSEEIPYAKVSLKETNLWHLVDKVNISYPAQYSS